MKVNLQILDFEDKKTKSNARYTRFKTNEGWMSCFDAKSCESLKDHTDACCEVVQSGDFKNIKKYLGPTQENLDEANEDMQDVEVVKVKSPKKATNGSASFYTAYAKDIFCALLDKHKEINEDNEFILMEHSTKLVKQAKTAFE